jgi:GNAT superfamily N-acetyltransferase
MSRDNHSVRRANPEDLARLVELGLRYYAEEGKREASAMELARFAISHAGAADRVCLVWGEPAKACLFGMIAPHYLTGEPVAFKTAWYAIPGARGYGTHLLRAFESWAKEKGARRIMVAGRQERTLALLERLGYEPLETVYAKDVPWQKQPFQPS